MVKWSCKKSKVQKTPRCISEYLTCRFMRKACMDKSSKKAVPFGTLSLSLCSPHLFTCTENPQNPTYYFKSMRLQIKNYQGCIWEILKNFPVNFETFALRTIDFPTAEVVPTKDTCASLAAALRREQKVSFKIWPYHRNPERTIKHTKFGSLLMDIETTPFPAQKTNPDFFGHVGWLVGDIFSAKNQFGWSTKLSAIEITRSFKG